MKIKWNFKTQILTLLIIGLILCVLGAIFQDKFMTCITYNDSIREVCKFKI